MLYEQDVTPKPEIANDENIMIHNSSETIYSEVTHNKIHPVEPSEDTSEIIEDVLDEFKSLIPPPLAKYSRICSRRSIRVLFEVNKVNKMITSNAQEPSYLNKRETKRETKRREKMNDQSSILDSEPSNKPIKFGRKFPP